MRINNSDSLLSSADIRLLPITSNSQADQHSPTRVCHFASGDLWAGAEVQVVTLLEALKQFPDLELSALLLNRGRLSDELIRCGIPVAVCDESRLGVVQLLRAVTSHMRRVRPHILHSHRYKEHILGAFAGKLSHNPLMIQTYHGLEENLPGWAGLKINLYKGLNVAVGKAMADGIVGVSSEITNILKRRYPSADVRCIRNGIDFARIVPTVERLAMRAQLGIGPDTFVVGTVGRLMPIKGFEQLIEAFARLRRQDGMQESKLVIVGDGPLRAVLGQCAETQEVSRSVMFLGMRTDVYNLMNAFDVFALSSLHEGVPMVLLEAMALGVPIVASHVGGIPEILGDSREAILVPPNEPQALARAIGVLAASSELRARLIRAARVRVGTQFSIQSSAVKMREMYRSLSNARECCS
jgi:glycosyltransferase involved in cell wall biosynthesis